MTATDVGPALQRETGEGPGTVAEAAVSRRYLSPAGLWYSAIGKRALDVAVAATGLLALALPLAILGAIVRLTSRGPAVFVQERIGIGQKPFRILKLRSMEAGGAGDGRTTPVGRLLRRFSLDELPQLVNVVRGEMSLVGPRPLLREELAAYDESHRGLRQSVTPGLTGLAQLRGRKDITPEERLRHDLEYVRTWSLRLDLQLLVQTVPAVLQARGAH